MLLPHYVGRTGPTFRPVDLGALSATRDLFIPTRRRDRTAFAIRTFTDEIVRILQAVRALFETQMLGRGAGSNQ